MVLVVDHLPMVLVVDHPPMVLIPNKDTGGER